MRTYILTIDNYFFHEIIEADILPESDSLNVDENVMTRIAVVNEGTVFNFTLVFNSARVDTLVITSQTLW